MAATETARSIRSIGQLLGDIGFHLVDPTVIHILQLLRATARNTRHHWIRHYLAAGEIDRRYLPTADHPADLLTKALPGPKVAKSRKAIGIESTRSR